MKNAYVLSAALIFFCTFGEPAARAYEETHVPNGGTITGTARLIGNVPPPRLFHLVLYPFATFCEKESDGNGNRAFQEFSLGNAGGLKDVVVAVQKVTKGKHFFHPKGEFHAINCTFSPLVSVVENHQQITVVNEDPVIHNLQVYQVEKGNIVLNQPLPVESTQRGTVNFAKSTKISQTICGMHEFMQNWTFVVDNPYYAITDNDGRFSIDGLPPGTYTVMAWHPNMNIVSKTVTVTPGGVSSSNFEFKSSDVERPGYTQQEEGRLGRNARIRKDSAAGP